MTASKPIGIGKTEGTFELYDSFGVTTGRDKPDDEGLSGSCWNKDAWSVLSTYRHNPSQLGHSNYLGFRCDWDQES